MRVKILKGQIKRSLVLPRIKYMNLVHTITEDKKLVFSVSWLKYNIALVVDIKR